MKTVTIPTCANPFVVIVNGIKYTYPAGATMEVPDDVAEVIEQHEEAKPEPAPVAPPFATGASSGGGGGASGGGGEKVIDLTKYADATGASFNNILLHLFLAGGGAVNAQGGDQFWTDINTDGRVKFVIDASAFDAGVTVECEAKSIIKRNGKTVSIETSFLLHSVEKTMVTLFFGWFDGGTAIIVAVETLNLPS